MDIEKVEEEFNRLQEELRRLKPDDPSYRIISENAERLSKIIGECERRDLDRISSNRKEENDISDIRVNMERVKTDRLREWLGLAKNLVGVAASIGLGVIAYKGEVVDFKLPIKALWDGAKNLLPRR